MHAPDSRLDPTCQVVPNAPEGRLKLAYRVLANALYAYLDLRADGGAGAAQLLETGTAAKWRTVRLPLRERNVVGQLHGPEVAHILVREANRRRPLPRYPI